MEESIVKEGFKMREVAIKAKENKIPVYNYPNYGGSEKTRIIRGVLIGDVKIWIPKSYRTIEEKLNYEALKEMKLKKMKMYIGEEAFFPLAK